MHGTDIATLRGELSTFSTSSADDVRAAEPGSPLPGEAADERLRVLQAVLSIASVGGYGALSLPLILSMAGVPRRSFNASFASPEDAFVVAHDRCVEQLLRAVRAAIDPEQAPGQQLRQGVQAAAAYLVADPARADALMLEVHVAGGRALRSQEEAVDVLVGQVRAVLGRAGIDDPQARRVASLGIGALREAIRARIARGELHLLPDVVGELVDAAFPLRSPTSATCRI
ncbi:MAG: TetR/AcrR family transcriptional regulator [Patulibacter sp.]